MLTSKEKVLTCPRPGWIKSRMNIRSDNILQKTQTNKTKKKTAFQLFRDLKAATGTSIPLLDRPGTAEPGATHVLQGRTWAAGNSPQILSDDPAGSLRHPPTMRLYAKADTGFSWSSGIDWIPQRLARLVLFLPNSAASTEYLAMQIDGPPPSTFPTAGFNQEVGGRQPPPA